MDFELRQRQVHLDFHTHPLVPDIGADFDADEFVSVLKEAHVNSVTCFSRCHHGMIYHETKFPAKHPNLKCNLLGEQIEACHKADIRVPVYITVGYDQYMLEQDPGIAQFNRDGAMYHGHPMRAGYTRLCFNAESYVDYCIEQTREVLGMFDVDGFFFDIILHDCYCPRCLDEMRRTGVDPESRAQTEEYGNMVVHRFKERMSKAVWDLNKNCTIFYNSGHVGSDKRPSLDFYSHMELESLPSGGWGYDHFPITARFARTLGKPFLGMTGRFHRSWGDFGGMKHPAALQFECLNMAALGGACSVGDQLHPSGKIDRATYDLIGSAYEKCSAIEPYWRDAQPLRDIAVFMAGSVDTSGGRVNIHDRAAMNILAESQHQFDFVDEHNDLSPYKVLVLPDVITLDDKRKELVKDFIEDGGSVLATYASGLNTDRDAFAIDGLPLDFKGVPGLQPEYVLYDHSEANPIPHTPVVLYEEGYAVESASDKVETDGHVYAPYFNRTPEHFCSHRQTPPEEWTGRYGMYATGSVVYYPHPLFKEYNNFASAHVKHMILRGIERLLPKPLLRCNAPSTARITVNEQDGRYVLHVLNYVPEYRSPQLPTIEEGQPMVDLELDLRLPRRVAKAYQVPGEQEIELTQDDNSTRLTIDRLAPDAVIVLEWA